MRAVVQRVEGACVSVDGTSVGEIEGGLLVYLGVASGDTVSDAAYLAEKVVNLRIFLDGEGKMNLSLLDTRGAALVVSQFTLLADARKGRRPSYGEAAAPEVAQPLYERFVAEVESLGVHTETGRFRAHMRVDYVNDGPVTILLDSRKVF